MKKTFLRALRAIETTPFSLGLFATTFLALILARLAVEVAMHGFGPSPFSFFYFEFSHTFLFFLCAYLVFVPLIAAAGKIRFVEALPLTLFGFLIILTPPVIDTIIFRGGTFWSFYEFDGLAGLIRRFFTFFGSTPDMGITWGVRVEVALASLGLGLYTYLKRGRFLPALGFLLLSYTVFFVLGTFPSYFTIIAVGLEKGFSAVTELDVAGMFLTPERLFSRADTDMRSALNMKMSLVFSLCAAGLVALHLFNWEKTLFRALARNARIPQIIYHGGLLFLGMLLAAHFTDTALSIDFFHVLGAIVLVLAVAFAWLASVVVNDLFDVAIDRETNAWRPLPTETIDSPTYATIGFLFFFFSLLFAGVVSFSALLLLLCYQAIAFLYSAPPLRLKRIPGLASLFSALAVLLVFFAGYVTVAPARDIAALPLPIVFLLLCAFAIALPLKDFKDITGDRRDGVLTIPVLFGEERAKLLLGALTFILFTVSVRILNLPAALFPAFLLGALAGYIILRSGSPRLPYRFLPGIVLAIVAAYGFVLLILAA